MDFEFESNCSDEELENIEKISNMFDVYLNNRIGYTLGDFYNAK